MLITFFTIVFYYSFTPTYHMHHKTKLLNDIIQWDVKTWGKSIPFWEKHFDLKNGMKALAVGEREGGMTLWLALQNVDVVCSDNKAFPKETTKLHDSYGVQNNIQYEEGVDVTDLSRYTENCFDVIVFKSVIGGLSQKNRQALAFSEMKRVLKPGGAVLFAENGKGSKLHSVFRKKFVKWNSYWRYIDYKNDQDLFSEYSNVYLNAAGFSASFGRSEKQRSFLASFDSIIQPIIPSSFNYVVFGVLIK